MDIVDKETRSRMMSGIRSKNTKPEMQIRSVLHKDGFRFRLHDTKLTGKPDLVLKKYNAIIFIHGCFWHRHNCKYFKWPKTRTAFWKKKLNKNAENDDKVLSILKDEGWRICLIWECALKDSKNDLESIIKMTENWLVGESYFLEVRS